MVDCRHCDDTGKCQDDFHSGATLFGGEDEAGQDHPSIVFDLFSECPSCGSSNKEYRPPCPHCKDKDDWLDDFIDPSKMLSFGQESSKEKRHRERLESENQERYDDGGSDTAANDQDIYSDYAPSSAYFGGASWPSGKKNIVERPSTGILVISFFLFFPFLSHLYSLWIISYFDLQSSDPSGIDVRGSKSSEMLIPIMNWSVLISYTIFSTFSGIFKAVLNGIVGSDEKSQFIPVWAGHIMAGITFWFGGRIFR